MLQLLHSKRLWQQVAKVRGDGPVIAAVAYANEDHLQLRAKDILICDASDSRIATGATTYALLSALAKRKVQLWHLDGLHAKVVRLSRHAVVGSANMTRNSRSLFEAAVLTDQPEALTQVDAMFSELRSSSKLKRIDMAFLHHIKDIPVISSGGSKAKASASSTRQPLTWLMGSGPLPTAQQVIAEPAVKAASQTEEPSPYFVMPLKVASRYPDVQRGDTLILADRKNKRVSRPVTVTGVVPAAGLLCYLHSACPSGEVAWTRVQAKLMAANVYKRIHVPTQLALDPLAASVVTSMFRPLKTRH